MKIGLLYGRWSTSLHGGFDIDGLYENRGLTGSESAFFNTGRALAKLGHDVHMSCLVTKGAPGKHPKLDGATLYALGDTDVSVLPKDCDAYVSWNEPDLLRPFSTSSLRVSVQQLNDYNYCLDGYRDVPDVHVACSQSHLKHLSDISKIPPSRFAVIPNSFNPEFYADNNVPRVPGSIVYSSSPDRGLHRILDIFEKVREIVPHASLHIFYEWKKVWERMKNENNIMGSRFRYINTKFTKLGMNGEHGVHVHGNVSNVEMAKRLMATRVFAYTCEPISYTEGFSVGTLDACAAGCVPIISDADALPEIYEDGVTIVHGRPGTNIDIWTQIICRALTEDLYPAEASLRASLLASRYTREVVGNIWNEFLTKAVAAKRASL